MQAPPGTNGLVIAGYFTNWSIYGRNYNVTDLARNGDKLTHILYAFAKVEDDGTVELTDVWADKDKTFEQTVDGQEDRQSNAGYPELHGNFKQLYLLKQRHRHLKVSLSIGGWSLSTNFSAVASAPEKRARFVQTAVDLLKDFGLDGIDIDWEFPKDERDAFHYVHLLYETRIALDMYQQRVQQIHQPKLLLSVAVPCSPSHYKLLRLSEMANYVDMFYLMAYDFAGSWDTNTGHQSALRGDNLSVDKAVTDYINAGVPAHKLVMGIPAYGRGFCNTGSQPGCGYNGLPKGSWEEGTYDYKDLPTPGAIEIHDHAIGASWCHHPNDAEFVTYDSPTVVRAKGNYILERRLGGAMFWELSGDHPANHPRSLVQTIHQTLSQPKDTMPNHLEYPESQFVNIRSQMQ